ncbi:uncharacterized protein LOC123008505 [Tribolium madens]|uniref:uncharacterized protein LOC123008505 n=1 Tax=Tribolium madens TaxID=41895 RepID=UPI001CF7483B|nr:uncharacterized protein LOC123008505 [Tribolium madens]
MKLSYTTLIFHFMITTFCAKLPSSFKKCDYKSPDLDQCLVEAIQTALVQLDHPMVGLPSLDPLLVERFSIGAGSGPVGVQENFQNAKLYGFTTGIVENAALSLSPNRSHLNFTITMPEFKILAQYQLEGQLLLIPVHGKGDATLLLKNVTGVVFLSLEKYPKKGFTHLKIVDGKVTLPKTDLLYMNFQNRENRTSEFSDMMNKVLNDNWRAIFDDVRSGYESFFTEIIVNLAGKFFDKVPLTEMLDNVE